MFQWQVWVQKPGRCATWGAVKAKAILQEITQAVKPACQSSLPPPFWGRPKIERAFVRHHQLLNHYNIRQKSSQVSSAQREVPCVDFLSLLITKQSRRILTEEMRYLNSLQQTKPEPVRNERSEDNLKKKEKNRLQCSLTHWLFALAPNVGSSHFTARTFLRHKSRLYTQLLLTFRGKVST